MQQLMIYGANGYTGRLICEEAARQGLQPILAGRNTMAISKLASQFGWPFRIFSLDTAADIATHLDGITVVLHCAGPFRHTAANMLQACLQKQVHYLDISGELEVFALAHSMHAKAVEAGIMLMPGTGFDVVPTDYMAHTLHQRMPDATTLELAFVNRGGGVSHGTATSMAGKLGEGGASRVNGKIVKEPIGAKRLQLELGGKRYWVGSIPWGDVYTAFVTTGIPNISAFTGLPKATLRLLSWQKLFNPLLRTATFRRWLQARIDKRAAGPNAAQRAAAYAWVWGRASNAEGKQISDTFCCADGYTLTAVSAVGIAKKVLSGDWKPGYHTPATGYGNSLKELIPLK